MLRYDVKIIYYPKLQSNSTTTTSSAYTLSRDRHETLVRVRAPLEGDNKMEYRTGKKYMVIFNTYLIMFLPEFCTCLPQIMVKLLPEPRSAGKMLITELKVLEINPMDQILWHV